MYARLFIGLAIGISSFSVPLYIAEIVVNSKGVAHIKFIAACQESTP